MELFDKWLEYFKKNATNEINTLHTRTYMNFIDVEAEYYSLMADLFDSFFKENEVIIDSDILRWVISFGSNCYVELLKAHKII
jgi:hypothetical protein